MGLVEERAFGVEDKRVAEVAEQEAIFLCFSTKAKASLTITHSLSLSVSLGLKCVTPLAWLFQHAAWPVQQSKKIAYH